MSLKLIWMLGGLFVIAAGVGTTIFPEAQDNMLPTARAGMNESDHSHSATLFVAQGITEPQSRTIQLFGEIPGRLAEIYVRAGDHIQAGDVLAQLDDASQVVGVEYARAAVDKAEARLHALREGDRPQERDALQAKLDEATATLDMAKLEANWTLEAMNQDAASEREVARTNNALALARAHRALAHSRWELSNAGTRAEEITAAEADVRLARAQLATAEVLLSRTRLTSPIEGQVIYQYAEVGELVHADAPVPIMTVGDCSRMNVRVDVDELDVGHVFVGQRTTVISESFPERTYHGTVVHIEPTLGRKNFRTQLPTERLDTRIQEVVVRLDESALTLPVELQVAVYFLCDRDDEQRLPEEQHRAAID